MGLYPVTEGLEWLGNTIGFLLITGYFINVSTYLDLAENIELISNNATKRQSLRSGAKSLQ